jgi:D-glycero-alpha-D-manno-heptose-7-phosphate kinase
MGECGEQHRVEKRLLRARAPLRISFAGGGTDVPPYSDECGGVVLNATVNRFAYATVVPQEGDLVVESLDYDAAFSCSLDEPLVYDGQLDLAKHVLDHFRTTESFATGLRVTLHNDAPPGSGLGSSSAITVAMVLALATHLRLPMDAYAVAQRAYELERVTAGIAGGKQDHYAAAFGGFSFIEFRGDLVVVNPLRVASDVVHELEYSLVFGYLGGARLGAGIIDRQVANYVNGASGVRAAMDRQKDIATEMKRALLLGNLNEFGDYLHESWECKKQMADGISNAHIDEVYDEARRAGALGGKIPGAGGGGYIVFFCPPGRLFSVQERLLAMGVELARLSFTFEGATSWRA